ncbi:hypothetical protein [Alkalihalobacillus sp. LMS39]|uniref:hypothetical protein n=1 Tax=Alkalihalobacillus sp. LMS39 TaxID=2924032 RepID=UPI001FB4C322|nr:hypothetical protein [Alkalihalobacillus sp. LMS39]UOE96071.1 hypothetical protein MM271_10925 [Alkalihalobacillus sp. LMS39]
MTYQVLSAFVEKEHKNITYKEGEIYPKFGFSADPSRVEYLQSEENKYKKAFLGPELPVQEKETKSKKEEEPTKVEDPPMDPDEDDSNTTSETTSKKSTNKK